MKDSHNIVYSIKIRKSDLDSMRKVAKAQEMTPSRFVREAIYDRLNEHFAKQPTSLALPKTQAKEPDEP